MKTILKKFCLNCNKKFSKSSFESLKNWINRHKFCSRYCVNKSFRNRRISKETKQKISLGLKESYKKGFRISYFKGRAPWSKGTKGLVKANSGSFKKGNIAPKTAFKKQDIRITGELNRLWKGDKVGYIALHGWIKRKLGKANCCVKCNNEKKRYEWANVSRTYKRDISDWISLCTSCHQYSDYHKLDLSIFISL